MIYRVIQKYHKREFEPDLGVRKFTPLIVRIFPENTNPESLLVAMIQSAFEMMGYPSVWGFDRLRENGRISYEEAKGYISYREDGTPVAIDAGFVRGRAVGLKVTLESKKPFYYEMQAYIFEKEVGSINKLFWSTRRKLKVLKEQAATTR